MKNANGTETAKAGLRKFLAAALASLAAFAGLADVSPQDGDVLLYLPFDNSMDTVAAVSENAGSTTSGTPAYDDDVYKMYVAEYSDPASAARPGSNIAGLKANKSTVTRTVTHPYMLSSDFNCATIEFFVKGSSADSDVATWENKLSLGNGTRCGLMVQASDAKKYYVKIQTDSSETYTVSPFAITDGKWHHIAIIIEPDNNGADTKITWNYDYGSRVVTTTKTGVWAGFRYNQTLTFGANKSVLWFDEFRITKGVLSTDKFMRFVSNPNPQDGDALLYMPLDGDMESISSFYAADIGGAGVQSGTSAYDADVWKSRIVEYGNQDVRVREGENSGCLKAGKANVKKGIVSPYMLSGDILESATIEFFMKGSSVPGEVADWENKLSLGNNNTKCGLMVQANNQTNYYLRVDTVDDKADVNAPVSMKDGNWHHFAITIEPVSDGAQTEVKFYTDYGDPVVKTATGAWCGLQYNREFSFGASKSVLWLDEFRVTKGVLPKSKFMKAKNASGLAIVVR